jgi:hypothetical protein
MHERDSDRAFSYSRGDPLTHSYKSPHWMAA